MTGAIIEFINDKLEITEFEDDYDPESAMQAIAVPLSEDIAIRNVITVLYEITIQDYGFHVATDNLFTIFKVIAGNRDYQNPTILKSLADYCFAPRIKSIWQNYECDQSEPLSEKKLKDHLNNQKHTMLYRCENTFQLLYSLEMLALRSGKHIHECKQCGLHFITNTKEYCSDECAKKARREQERKSHQTLPDEVKKWRTIQQRLYGRIKRENNPIIKKRLESEYDQLIIDKDNAKDSMTKQDYINWLKKKDKETKEKR